MQISTWAKHIDQCPNHLLQHWLEFIYFAPVCTAALCWHVDKYNERSWKMNWPHVESLCRWLSVGIPSQTFVTRRRDSELNGATCQLYNRAGLLIFDTLATELSQSSFSGEAFYWPAGQWALGEQAEQVSPADCLTDSRTCRGGPPPLLIDGHEDSREEQTRPTSGAHYWLTTHLSNERTRRALGCADPTFPLWVRYFSHKHQLKPISAWY